MTCSVLSHLPVCSHVCMRPALCGPHASQPPAMSRRRRSRLRLRPRGLLARAWARPVFLPSALPACVPGLGTMLAFPAGPPACCPSRQPPLSGATRSATLPAILLSSCRLQTPNCRRRPAIQPAPALPSVAAFPLCAPEFRVLGLSLGPWGGSLTVVPVVPVKYFALTVTDRSGPTVGSKLIKPSGD